MDKKKVCGDIKIFKEEKNSSKKELCVSLKTLATIIISLILGIITLFLYQNALAPETINFSTPDLIGFMLSVLLSGASIVLAITAIILGKTTEQAIIKRNDESIFLLNDIFQKTTEALARIETSTGVTEKRIDDMLSGRAGDISRQIIKVKGDKEIQKTKLEEEDIINIIKNVTTRELTFPTNDAIEGIKNRLFYQEAHGRLLKAIATIKGIKELKAGHGNVTSSGDDRYDAIYEDATGKRVAISTFSSFHKQCQVQAFIEGALGDLQKDLYSRVLIILFDKNLDQIGVYENIISLVKTKYVERLKLLVINPEEIETSIAGLEIG